MYAAVAQDGAPAQVNHDSTPSPSVSTQPWVNALQTWDADYRNGFLEAVAEHAQRLAVEGAPSAPTGATASSNYYERAAREIFAQVVEPAGPLTETKDCPAQVRAR
jgi:hypothetical protein